MVLPFRCKFSVRLEFVLHAAGYAVRAFAVSLASVAARTYVACTSLGEIANDLKLGTAKLQLALP